MYSYEEIQLTNLANHSGKNYSDHLRVLGWEHIPDVFEITVLKRFNILAK